MILVPHVVVLFILLAIVFRIAAGGMDGERIRSYIKARGGEAIDVSWTPFGRGWYGEERDRIYRVRYRDQESKTRVATVKTSMMGGVYFTDDHVLDSPARTVATEFPFTVQALKNENDELRRRIAELENGQAS